MSVSELAASLATVQRQLVLALQAEYFCDDLELPAAAFGWEEAQLRAYFESGGSQEAAAEPETAPPPAPVTAPPPAPVAAPTGQQPVVLCLGDAVVEFGSHVTSPKDIPLDKGLPKAGDVLRSTGTDNPRVEHGPGWTALLARDFAWRGTATVANLGGSGYTSSLLRRDLDELLAPLRAGGAAVAAVVLCVGGNDHAPPPEPCHVPLDEFRSNLLAMVASLRAAFGERVPVLLLTPTPVDAERRQRHVAALTGGASTGGGRGGAQLAKYAAAVVDAAGAARCHAVDLGYAFKYKMAQAHEALAEDGRLLSSKGNAFMYRQVKDKLDEVGVSPISMPARRAAALAAAYPDGDDTDGKLRRKPPRKPRPAGGTPLFLS